MVTTYAATSFVIAKLVCAARARSINKRTALKFSTLPAWSSSPVGTARPVRVIVTSPVRPSRSRLVHRTVQVGTGCKQIFD